MSLPGSPPRSFLPQHRHAADHERRERRYERWHLGLFGLAPQRKHGLRGEDACGCGTEGDEQFEINDDRSFEKMYEDMAEEGLQPVLNDYLYV